MKENVNNRRMTKWRSHQSALSKSTAISNDKDTNNSNIPNQYARLKNVAKGEDVIKENTDQTYAFVDELLEEAIKL
jgi:hypothetical protein